MDSFDEEQCEDFWGEDVEGYFNTDDDFDDQDPSPYDGNYSEE